MSIPPQLIRVKRKRVEEAPVTFLQFDDGEAKRHRATSNWVYQRRDSTSARPKREIHPRERQIRPIIHVSKPDNESPTKTSPREEVDAPPKRKALSPRASQQKLRPEPRRFHLSRSGMLAAGNESSGSGISKNRASSPAVFIERSRKKLLQKGLPTLGPTELSQQKTASSADHPVSDLQPAAQEPKQVLKKPGTTRAKSSQQDAPARAPLPDSFAKPHSEDMSKRAADMNQWVLNEIGANLHQMEVEKKKTASPNRFKPKAPAKRFFERHPEEAAALQPPPTADSVMSDVSDEEVDDEDWIIEEYVRIPAKSMAADVLPTDVGVLVLDGDEDSILFFGLEHDDDDDFAEDDEDENAENHYTADYPEDEVESDDEYGRRSYYYRNRNASDDEEFDHQLDSDSDEMVLEGDDDDDVTMARIKEYMRRNKAY